MIRIERIVTPSPEQMDFIVEGMRNAYNSWSNSDSGYVSDLSPDLEDELISMGVEWKERFHLGDADKTLMKKLAAAGTDHRKFMRMMTVYIRITAPLYWWKEFDTYKIGTVANSCSTMHTIAKEPFAASDFSFEHVFPGDEDEKKCTEEGITPIDVALADLALLNRARALYLETHEKKWWWAMIQLLPSSYNQTRNVMLNYETLANIFKSRRTHKLTEWREFCAQLYTLLPYPWLLYCPGYEEKD